MLGQIKGALAGLISGAVVNFWIGAGAVLFVKPPPLKILTIEGCPIDNSTEILTTTALMQTASPLQEESAP